MSSITCEPLFWRSHWNYADLPSAAATRGGRLGLEHDGRFRTQEALTGLQEGPTNVLLDGTRYEYDTILKRTVEITPSGARRLTRGDRELKILG